MTWIYLNNHFVEEEAAMIHVSDRGFLYGDGLFETIRIENGLPFLLEKHYERLTEGAEFLHIPMPLQLDDVRDIALELVRRNNRPCAALRIELTRGAGGRGYTPPATASPTLILSLYETSPVNRQGPGTTSAFVSELFHLHPAKIQLFKTNNKLVQVLAAMEAARHGFSEAILTDTNGYAAETSSGNLFWIRDKTVYTPPIQSVILPGITRALIIELCNRLDIPCREGQITPADLLKANAVFLTQSVSGIKHITQINGVKSGISPVLTELWHAYCNHLKAVCNPV
ncbi:MAG: aminotransferase class IV [Verrucomicrobia bacterium]|nr:aminotransferase class IV [Verrucomicrobiota bacterium]MCF7709384.1 aminotransferase class IV [Verrucomicrobiota bacterium]